MIEYRSGVKKNTKKNLQSIQFFNYYQNFIFPKLFSIQKYPQKQPGKYKGHDRNIQFHYIYQSYQGVNDFTETDIIKAAQYAYFSGEGSKIEQNIFVKKSIAKLPFLPIWKQFSEKINIFIEREGKSQSRGEEKLSLYIIHYNNTDQKQNSGLCWQNFIQRYEFQSYLNEGSAKPSVIYEVIFSFRMQSSLLSLNQAHKIIQKFYENSIFCQKDESKLQMPQKLLQRLRNIGQQSRLNRTSQSLSPSFDLIHRRQLRLTPQQLAVFNHLKPRTYTYFKSLHKQREANPYLVQNLICRMMGNNCFKQSESWQAIKYYLQFEKRMREKYSWSHFDKYNRMNIFTYVGKDLMGRPILLDRLRNNLLSQIQDLDDYFHYHTYLFEIYMQDQMEGWVDQFIVLADMADQVQDNTNLTFTKRLVMEGFKVFTDRAFRVFAYDMGFLGVLVHKLLKSLIPASLKQCLRAFGDNRQQLIEELRIYISDDVIPDFLGGNNIIDRPRLQQKEMSTKISENSSFTTSI